MRISCDEITQNDIFAQNWRKAQRYFHKTLLLLLLLARFRVRILKHVGYSNVSGVLKKLRQHKM
jgi:hypothetical protein